MQNDKVPFARQCWEESPKLLFLGVGDSTDECEPVLLDENRVIHVASFDSLDEVLWR